MMAARQWRDAALALRQHAAEFEERARQIDAASNSLICGVVSNSGYEGEPLACGFTVGHIGQHAWATLPTFRATDGAR